MRWRWLLAVVAGGGCCWRLLLAIAAGECCPYVTCFCHTLPQSDGYVKEVEC